MKNHWFLRSVALLGFVGAACLPLGAQLSGSAPPPGTPEPGTVNYMEGQVSIDGRALTRSQAGYSTLHANQTLSTGAGKAEILLSPGVFLRVGDNSRMRMISQGLAEPQVELVQGEAMVEVDWMPKDERIGVLERGAQSLILKPGLYKFDANAARAQVIEGKMQVTENDVTKEISKGKEVSLTAAKLKAVGFDRNAEDDLYRWSNVRAGYLAEANTVMARNYAGAGYGPYATGWYWDPYFDFWSWMPYDGYFFSPFGYPFFSPGYAVYSGRFGYGYGFRGGYAGRGFAGRGGVALAPRIGGFRGGGGFAGGGGFHGGGRR